MTDTPATIREAEAKSRNTVIGILEFAGLHRCQHVAGRIVFCGCRPGECQQAEADNA